MNHPHKTVTRRRFLGDSSKLVIGSSVLCGASTILARSDEPDLATVVLIRNRDLFDADETPRSSIVLEMLDTAVSTLTGKKDPLDAWRTLIRPSDVVGIKTNEWNPISTTSQVEQALKERVRGTGVPEDKIAISDRQVRANPIFQQATALVNARPMRTHHWSGVGSLIKNYIMFVPDPYNYHADACASLGSIWNLPQLKGKTRLNVLVMFTPQFHNVGPHGFSPRHVWKYYGMLVGFDPVAVDTLGVRIIQAQRKVYFGEDRPLTPPASHISVADSRYHLGTADPERIRLVRIGYEKDALI
jgi:hypothetical protein